MIFPLVESREGGKGGKHHQHQHCLSHWTHLVTTFNMLNKVDMDMVTTMNMVDKVNKVNMVTINMVRIMYTAHGGKNGGKYCGGLQNDKYQKGR